MKKWNWKEIIKALFLIIGAIGGGAYGLETAGIIDLNPQPVEATTEPLAAVPGAPVYYVVNAQVIWKATPNALPGTQYIAVTHQIRMDKVPTLGSAFNAVKDAFVSGRIKPPVTDFVPVYAYSAELVTRVGIPLEESGDKPTGPETE